MYLCPKCGARIFKGYFGWHICKRCSYHEKYDTKR